MNCCCCCIPNLLTTYHPPPPPPPPQPKVSIAAVWGAVRPSKPSHEKLGHTLAHIYANTDANTSDNYSSLYCCTGELKIPNVGKDKCCPAVIKQFSCSTQLSMKLFLLINVKMPTNVGILTFMSRKKHSRLI